MHSEYVSLAFVTCWPMHGCGTVGDIWGMVAASSQLHFLG